MDPDLSIVIPCYNEEESLPHTLEVLLPALEHAAGDAWEVILVDDGSADATFQLIAEAHHDEDRIKGIRLSRNFGHQAAITAGLAFASGAHVGVIDADLQDPVEILMELYLKVAGGDCDVSICSGCGNTRSTVAELDPGQRQRIQWILGECLTTIARE